MIKTFADKRTQDLYVNDQWRIYFRFKDGDAYEVEICDQMLVVLSQYLVNIDYLLVYMVWW
jgi:hypothetical protein